MPDRPHSVPGVRSFHAELTDRISQLQQQEGRAFADEHLLPPATHGTQSHTHLAKLLQKCRKGEDGWIAVVSPAPLRAVPSQSPFWTSSGDADPCASPAVDASTTEVTASHETELEGQMDGQLPVDAAEAHAENIDVANEILATNCKQLNELAQQIQQIAAWNNLNAQLTFSQLQTLTPPSTPTPLHSQQATCQLRIPSRQHSYDWEDADMDQEGQHPRQLQKYQLDEAELEAESDAVLSSLRAATPTVQIPEENSPASSSGLASDPVSPSSAFSSPCASSSLSFQPFPALLQRCASLSSHLRQSVQGLDSCIPLLLEEMQRRQLQSIIEQKRNEQIIDTLEKELQRMKTENERLRLQYSEKNVHPPPPSN